MTDVTKNQDQAEAEMPATDAHVLRELAEQSRVGSPKLTSAGDLLGKLTELAVGDGRQLKSRRPEYLPLVRQSGSVLHRS